MSNTVSSVESNLLTEKEQIGHSSDLESRRKKLKFQVDVIGILNFSGFLIQV